VVVWLGFKEKKMMSQVRLNKYFILLYVKKNLSLKTLNKIVLKNIHSIKKDQKNLQEMYAVQIEKIALGKKNFI
jgi:hypothetical protein